ncbi:LamB/YcsF family protein [Alkalibacillus sp. S2W]|uniref:LamB/YcsF family protein n=1 Tax=Alkalibacillus sp. S2W TaxID=3386553 RepID=UPI00398CD3F1
MEVDLNADIGESFGPYKIGDDQRLMDIVSSVNVACGFHGGDYRVMHQVVKQAVDKNVKIGAHPGYPDLIGFGRRHIEMTSDEIYQLMVYQIGALQAVCHAHQTSLHHVKPHGALYNLAAKDREVAHAVAQAVFDVDHELLLFGLANSALLEAGEAIGLKVVSEVFADRTYTEEGLLTPRSQSRSVLTEMDDIKEQVQQIVFHHGVTTPNGTQIHLRGETICFHGDGEDAYQHARFIREYLQDEGVVIKARDPHD